MRLVILLVVLFATSSARAQDSASSTPSTSDKSAKQEGFFLRAGVEHSFVRFHHAYVGNYSAQGASTRFSADGISRLPAWGGRFDGGYALVRRPGFAVLPRAALTVARMQDDPRRVEVAALEHRWTLEPWWVSLAGGVEVQMLERMFGLSADVGLAGIHERVRVVTPAGLEVEAASNYGALGRLGTSLRLPTASRFGAGLTASAEAIWNPFDSAVPRRGMPRA
jgi:hypothetical protein